MNDPFYQYEGQAKAPDIAPHGWNDAIPQPIYPESPSFYGAPAAPAATPESGGGGGSPQPFAVAITDPVAMDAAISAYSYLHKSFTTAQTITGLTTEFELTSTLKVWLNVTVDSSLAVTGASIATGTSFPSLIVGSPTQTAFNVPIGRVIAGPVDNAPGFAFQLSSTDYHFEQMLNTHLMASVVCNDGTPAVYAFPWSGL